MKLNLMISLLILITVNFSSAEEAVSLTKAITTAQKNIAINKFDSRNKIPKSLFEKRKTIFPNDSIYISDEYDKNIKQSLYSTLINIFTTPTGQVICKALDKSSNFDLVSVLDNQETIRILSCVEKLTRFFEQKNEPLINKEYQLLLPKIYFVLSEKKSEVNAWAGLNHTFIFFNPKHHKEIDLYKSIIHELYQIVDFTNKLTSNIFMTDYILSYFNINTNNANSCEFMQVLYNPYVKLATSQLRSKIIEVNVLNELGFSIADVEQPVIRKKKFACARQRV